MNRVATPTQHDTTAAPSALTAIAPRPTSLAECGLTDAFVAELIVKHLYEAGVADLRTLAARIRLPGTLLEERLDFLRREARVEIRAATTADRRYALTDGGRVMALDALMRSGYVGPAPVPLEQYLAVSRAQTVHANATTDARMRRVFDNVVLEPGLLDKLGAAMNSGRAIFIYGPAGTGKTYITQRLAGLLSDTILIPYAVAVDEIVVEMFDPVLHKIAKPQPDGIEALTLSSGHDPRYACCARPVAVAGGELTLDMLEIRYDSARKTYRAPLQLRANNGVLIIDDMGRQRADPASILNRWIVPLEEGTDYLHLGTGSHFAAPFDLVLVFSTNMNPLELADEAFLRRIGYKIHFDYLQPREYGLIWQQYCEQLGVDFDPALLEWTIENLHRARGVPMAPCHPRDLLRMALDHASYVGDGHRVTRERLIWAWENYFVRLDGNVDAHTETR